MKKQRNNRRGTVPAAEAAAPGRAGGAWLCWLLIVLVVGLYAPALKQGFIAYDDPGYVTSNAMVRQGLSWEGLGWALTTGHAYNWHPVTWVSHMADCQAYGLAAWGHHLTSILLHAVNTALVFLVFRAMTGAVWRSVVVAALFGMHPLHVESVAWVAERKDVLSTFFWLLTMGAYVRYVKAGKKPKAGRSYALALVFFSLGLMSKPMVVTLPCVLLLLDYWPLARVQQGAWSSLIREKIPFFALSVVSCVVTFCVQQKGGAVQAAEAYPLAGRVGNAFVSYMRYLGGMVWPEDLSVFYPYQAWNGVQVVLACMALAGITACVALQGRRRRYLPVGWFWYLGTLVPVIGLVQVGGQSMADRYTYVPMIGVGLMLAWGLEDLTRGWRHQRIAAWTLALLVLAGCAVQTWRQIRYWKNDETLFRHALAVTRGNWMAHVHYGLVLQRQGKGDEAIAEYRAALASDPHQSQAHLNLAVALFNRGNYDEALEHAWEGLRNRPDDADGHYVLGIILEARGHGDEAELEYKKALQRDPGHARAHYRLGIALGRRGDIDGAIRQFEETVKADPDNADAHNDLGGALLSRGRMDKAEAELRQALRIRPDFPDARENLGILQKIKAGAGKPRTGVDSAP